MASESAESESLVSLFNSLMSISSAFSSSGSEQNSRIMIINPVTRNFLIIGTSGDGDGFGFNDGVPPASKASIEGMKKIELKSIEEIETLGGDCVICMEEFVVGDVAKEMPCQHKFHGECVDKWLNIHGSCPVCRFKMPGDDDVDKKNGGRSEIWVTAGIARLRSDEGDDDVSDSG